MTRPVGTRDSPRRLEVAPDRIERWVVGFAERHGQAAVDGSDPAVTLTAADGSVAALEPLCPNGSWRSSLSAWAECPESVALVLIRRGGYAVGLAEGASLAAHKVGTRYVQSRTAAGGWSQQRFARRRGNQADELVGAVTEHCVRLVVPRPAEALVVPRPAEALVVGGDRTLVTEVLKDTRLKELAALPRRELFDLPDPRLVILQRALGRGRAVRIALTEATSG